MNICFYICAGDGDDDVLAYPKARKKIANRQGQLKYFVLTSQEAYSAKLKYHQDKIEQEREKCERKQLRLINAAKRLKKEKKKKYWLRKEN